MSYKNIREEELKNKVAQDYFSVFDCTKIIGNVDFCVTLKTQDGKQVPLFETESLLWAEAKQGKSEIYKSIVQLILTIGKARTFDKNMPPAYIGAFDGEKIAFISYNDIHDIFYVNDFNWNVAPSNHETKEFQLVYEKVKSTIENNSLLFFFDKDDKELHEFVKINFIIGKSHTSKIKIDKNNFIVIYNKWLVEVKPTIMINWDIAKKNNVIDGDFYLADLLSHENESIKEKLSILLKKDRYELERGYDEMGLFKISSTFFSDKQKAHTQFWNKYERPPKEEYWDYIVERRDLLVPQDVRERKGSFFTPQIWVELSQKYITDVLGVDWQDEYYIWDCAAGTGNLLTGLTNKYNIWASTLDRQDVDVMHERIETMNKNSINGEGANLLHDHVFQFDFLNDDFSKLPKGLFDIINDSEKRKKLLIYINPPYKRGLGVANTKWHKDEIGAAKDELFAQFMYRIYKQIPDCILAEFSKLKALQAPNFLSFRKTFLSKLIKMFIVQANTFDNVKGRFPIGFKIWNTNKKEFFTEILSDVYDSNGKLISQKLFANYDEVKVINLWLKEFTVKSKINLQIGLLNTTSNDFQHQNRVIIVNYIPKGGDLHKSIHISNLINISIYYTVRTIIEPTWLNDRDQFLYPNDKWKTDTEFQNDCFTYTLFSSNIQSKHGTNHWIPFTEYEVASREKFDSSFMTDFITGKTEKNVVAELFDNPNNPRTSPLEFSTEAKAVFAAGKAVWNYYHKQPNCNVNASLHEIREHFQGRNEKGKMNNKSDDETYMKSIKALREQLQLLAKKIESKVYEYGFLKV